MEQQISNDLSRRPDVLMVALARHDGPYSSTAWSLAKAFAARSRVFYVDNPFTLIDFFKTGKREQIQRRYTLYGKRKFPLLQPEPSMPGLHIIVPPLMLPINWLPAGRIYNFFNRINNFLLRKAINKVLKNMSVQDYLYLNSYNPFYGAEARFTPAPAHYIYQTVDNISESRYVSKHGPALEAAAMQKAHACVATSSALQQKAAAFNTRAVCIPNAADISLFRRAVEEVFIRPAGLDKEKRKIIGYTGHIDHRIDYKVLVHAANRHLDKLFLMIGPISGEEWKTSGLAELPNVRFAGKKTLAELPAYLQYIDCAIIPFKCNRLTASIYPLKINEYLAAGKAVVSTPFSEDIKQFRGLIELASGENFAQALQQALDSDSAESRRERLQQAAGNNWEQRVEAFWSLCNGADQDGDIKRREYEKALG